MAPGRASRRHVESGRLSRMTHGYYTTYAVSPGGEPRSGLARVSAGKDDPRAQQPSMVQIWGRLPFVLLARTE